MSRNYSKKRRLKYVLFAAACTASFAFGGFAAACDKPDDSDDDEEQTTSREDSQLLKNGDFEYFDVPAKKKDQPAPQYLINTPKNWTHGGTTSYTMSGIIGTSAKDWAALTREGLEEDLDVNNALDSSASDYKEKHVDYNGMKSSDLLYKDTYAALNDKDEDDEEDGDATEKNRKEFIKNPETHYNLQEKDGKLVYVMDDGTEKPVYEDDKGDYYLEYDQSTDKYSQPISHVLMLHNYATEHNGIAQNYSSVEISLPANTAAEISLWVKTSDLLYHQGEKVSQDRGANIYVTHTAGSSTLSDFAITAIDTEKLIAEKKVSEDYAEKYNGWVEYTVYINSCDFASSNVTLKLGLGETGYPVEGYAFFDDVSVKRFANLNDENCTYSENKTEIEKTYTTEIAGVTRDASCTLTSDASEKIFKAGSYTRNGGTVNIDRFASCFHYFIDLASEEGYKNITLTDKSLKTGLTVDADNYVSSKNTDIKYIGFNGTEPIGNAKLPTDFTSLDTSRDLLALVKADHEFTDGQSEYYERLNAALGSAKNLNSRTDDSMIVMLSAFGASYTTSMQFEIDGNADGKFNIISFWVKTSDMGGSTAATVKISEQDNKDNTASITVDSTNVTTDIDDDHKDIYNGWVQCFFFVRNNTEENVKYNIDLCFGNTTIGGTTASNYKPGWIALANMQVLDVDKDVFSYTSSGTYSASLTFNEDEEGKNSVFDEAYGSQSHEIRNNIVNPSTYTGVNGASSYIVNNGHVSIPFDDINSNPNAGLINKEYFKNYYGKDWHTTLLNKFGVASTLDALTAWNEIFGKNSIQPLIIVNKLRDDYVQIKDANETNYTDYLIRNSQGEYVTAAGTEYDEKETYYARKQVMNYGFIGSDKTVSADGFSIASVRVKVSEGAVAYIYLADTANDKDVLGFTAPDYSFYYDEDGNVLKAKPDPDATLAEKRENVLYTLRNDGLYEDAQHNLFANTYNYKKLYQDEDASYYDKDGKPVSFEDLIDGEIYYADAAKSKEANHFLVTTDGIKVYEYFDGSYYYIVKGERNADLKVTPFELDKLETKYDYSNINEDYVKVIDGNKDEFKNKWVTVNFVIHAGSASKTYRLELWSGARNELQTAGNLDNGTVLFDYSYTTISNNDVKDYYENEIIKAYQRLLASKNLLKDIATSEENISYYEELVESYKGNQISQEEIDAIKNNYTAHYYTFSLYDSENYQPFNRDVNTESTGYDYNHGGYEETLAYLSVKDGDTYNVFADYSPVNQNVTLDTDDTDDGDDDEDEDKEDNTSVWLLISSIILVVALLFAMISLLLRDTIRKMRHKKAMSANNYNNNYNRANRYIKKLGIKKEEIEEVDVKEVNADDEVTPDEAAPQTEDVQNDEALPEEESDADDTDKVDENTIDEVTDNPEDGKDE